MFESRSHLDGPLHRLPALPKLLLALASIAAIVAVPIRCEAWLWGAAAALVLLAVASRLPLAFLLGRLLLLETMVLGVAAMSLLQPGGGRIFLSRVVRSTLCLGVVLLLSNTTPFTALLGAMRRLRVPELLITTMALMHRYLFVLLEESRRMRRARASRTFTSGRRFTWRSLSTVAGMLFVRAGRRADRVYAAMCARGWPS